MNTNSTLSLPICSIQAGCVSIILFPNENNMKTQGNDSGVLSKQLLTPTPNLRLIVTDGMESETFPPTLTINCLRVGTRQQVPVSETNIGQVFK